MAKSHCSRFPSCVNCVSVSEHTHSHSRNPITREERLTKKLHQGRPTVSKLCDIKTGGHDNLTLAFSFSRFLTVHFQVKRYIPQQKCMNRQTENRMRGTRWYKFWPVQRLENHKEQRNRKTDRRARG